MDANDQAKLEQAKHEIEKYLNLPITRELVQANEEEQAKLLKLITNDDVRDIETLFAHFVSIGHLRGLRAGYVSMRERLAEIQENLENAK